MVTSLLVFGSGSKALGQRSHSDLQHALDNSLVGKVLVLRGYYSTEELRFDQGGALLSAAEEGYARSDAGFGVERIEVKPDKLVIDGALPVMFLDRGTLTIRYLKGLVKRKVEIDLPVQFTREAAIAAIWKVFFEPGETDPDCPVDEASRFQKYLPKPPYDYGPDGPAALTGDLGFCTRDGEEVVRAESRSEQPHPIHSPKPIYPEQARNDRRSGNVVLRLLITPQGLAQSIIVVNALGDGLDEEAARAVHGWRFAPPTRYGKPVAMVVTFEVHFTLVPR